MNITMLHLLIFLNFRCFFCTFFSIQLALVKVGVHCPVVGYVFTENASDSGPGVNASDETRFPMQSYISFR